ncbi:MAG TPA: FAD binding domain-containing protein [Myxococcota bacterium]|nr:FAD binding domain-containing protein [Myxococcota bacterium]
MEAFRYEAPTTLDAALALLAREAAVAPEQRPAILAGGTDLIVQMRGGLRRPAAVIDVKRVPELARIDVGADGLSLGAAVPCASLRGREDVRALWPGLVEAAELIGSMQIQGRATVVGNLCNASPAADTVPSLLVLGARVRIAGPRGVREVPVSDFCVAPGRNALAPDELATALFVPRPAARSADAYLRFTPRAEMDIAVVGAAARVTLAPDGRCTAAAVALGAVAERALLAPAAAEALVGTRLEPASLARAADAARAAARPIDDKRGTAFFRRHVTGVLVTRAVERAAARAGARP